MWPFAVAGLGFKYFTTDLRGELGYELTGFNEGRNV
jgi:hypothetical protein